MQIKPSPDWKGGVAVAERSGVMEARAGTLESGESVGTDRSRSAGHSDKKIVLQNSRIENKSPMRYHTVC